LFLKVKKATTIGMMIKIKARHIKPMATGAPIGSVLDSPLMVVVNGTPASPIMPDIHIPKPGQAQHKTVTIVKTIPTVLFIQPPLVFWYPNFPKLQEQTSLKPADSPYNSI
jgi:hypothetical protein